MDVSRLDPHELRRHMRLAIDVVMAHRIVRKLSLDRVHVTAIREVIEERVTLALQETDEAAMPPDWSWQHAVEIISQQIALAIVKEQKSEPPVDSA